MLTIFKKGQLDLQDHSKTNKLTTHSGLGQKGKPVYAHLSRLLDLLHNPFHGSFAIFFPPRAHFSIYSTKHHAFVLSVWLKNAWPNAQELHSYAQTLSKGAAFRCLGEFTKFETVLLLITNKKHCK